MAKDKSESRKLEKEEKKKKKRSEDNGVHKEKSSKDKKEKKSKREALAERTLNKISSTAPTSDAAMEVEKTDDEEPVVEETKSGASESLAPTPVGALVPFANPLADEKVAKKVFKSVKKGMLWATISSASQRQMCLYTHLVTCFQH